MGTDKAGGMEEDPRPASLIRRKREHSSTSPDQAKKPATDSSVSVPKFISTVEDDLKTIEATMELDPGEKL